MLRKFVAGESGPRRQPDQESEPGRVRLRVALEESEFRQLPQAVVQPFEVPFPRRREAVELIELGAADRRLQVGRLQIVAEVAVNVFVIVSGRKRAEPARDRLPQRLSSPEPQEQSRPQSRIESAIFASSGSLV